MARVMAAPRPAAGTLEEFLAEVEHQAYRMARHALRDHELALDIVQDSMLKLVEHYADRPGPEWPALFFTILNNRITDSRRNLWLHRVVSLFGLKRDGEGETETDLLESGTFGLHTADSERPEEQLHARRLRQTLQAAIERLPQRQRQVYLLRECQEFSVKETAQALGCSGGAVKQHHFRAMRALRGLLAEVWDDEYPKH